LCAADVDACSSFPCTSTDLSPASCTDLDNSAPNSLSGRTCTCTDSWANYTSEAGCTGAQHPVNIMLTSCGDHTLASTACLSQDTWHWRLRKPCAGHTCTHLISSQTKLTSTKRIWGCCVSTSAARRLAKRGPLVMQQVNRCTLKLTGCCATSRMQCQHHPADNGDGRVRQYRCTPNDSAATGAYWHCC
jgi:hypothetical protein